MDLGEESIKEHEAIRGKISIALDYRIESQRDLSIAYTPGIARVAQEVAKDPARKYDLTSIGKFVAVISNGTAVLGLGNIGAEGSYPVMEGKAALFKRFAGVDAFPIVLDITDPEELIETVEKLSINFSGVNLEDIKAPECFVIERALSERLDIPVFHDDQHGTAIVVSAALTNALALRGTDIADAKIVISGAGAAGIAIAKLLAAQAPRAIIAVDSRGILTSDREYRPGEDEKRAIAAYNPGITGSLADALEDADVFIGVSKAGILNAEDVKRMAERPIIFALANPDPEIDPQVATTAGAYIVATGRSDYPNQINNVLAFPGVFAGALKARAKSITAEMKLAAADAIAKATDPRPDALLPGPLDTHAHEAVAKAVADAVTDENRR